MKIRNLLIRKKIIKKMILITSFLILSIILLYIFHNHITNFIALNTKSSKEYFSYVAKKNIDHTIDNLFSTDKKAKNDKMTSNPSSIGYKNTLSFQALFGDAFVTDINSMNQIDLKDISFNISKQIKDEFINYIIQLRRNQVGFLTLSTLIDEKSGQIYITIPELSKATFLLFKEKGDSFSADTSSMSQESNATTEHNFTSSELQKLIKKYAYYLIDQVDGIGLDKKDKLTIHDISQTTAKITFSLSFKELVVILNNLLEKASYDSDIEKIVVSSGICNSTQYKSTLSLVMIAMNMYLHDKDLDGSITFNIWVNNKGNITGKNISYSYGGTDITLSYKLVQEGTQISYISSLTYNKANSSSFDLSMEGDGQLDGFNFDGNLSAKVNYKNLVNSSNDKSYESSLSYQLKDIFKADKIKLAGNGIVTDRLDSDSIYNINLTFDNANSSGLIKVIRDNMDYITLEMNKKKESQDSLTPPSKDTIMHQGIKDIFQYFNSLKFKNIPSVFP